MRALLDFLNQNNGAFTVLFSAVVAIATVVYAVLTWVLVNETRKMREAQTEPKISVIIEPSEMWLNLVNIIVQNIGLGPAYNLSFELNPEIEASLGKSLKDMGFIKHGVRYLAPNQRLQSFLTTVVNEPDERIKTPFEVKVIYQNSIGKKYEDKYRMDFTWILKMKLAGPPPLYTIAQNIEEIKKVINHFSTGFDKLHVIAYSKKENEEEFNQLLNRDDGLKDWERVDSVEPEKDD